MSMGPPMMAHSPPAEGTKRFNTPAVIHATTGKFSGVAMLGGVTMNGETIFSQATEELEKLEEQIQLAFELPINYMIG